MPCQQNSAGRMSLPALYGIMLIWFYSIPAISSASVPALTPAAEKKA